MVYDHARQLERELNAANERVKQIEADAYKSTQKIQRLEGWNTQNCADKMNLMETLRDREERIKRMARIGSRFVNADDLTEYMATEHAWIEEVKNIPE